MKILYNERMKSFLIHGVYDEKTLETIEGLGPHRFAFDLRARSLNLVTFQNLNRLLSRFQGEEIFLIFGNDLPSTIESYLNLLKEHSQKITLIFREEQTVEFYQNLNRSFYWMFDPYGNWKSILSVREVRGVLLPIKYKSFYEAHPELWNLIQARNLEVFLHAENFDEALQYGLQEDVNLSIELGQEVHMKYRSIDQEKLKRSKIWRNVNESPLV